MQNEMLENIDRIKRVYRYCKRREYQEIEAFLDAYKKTYFPDKIESNYVVADIQFAFENRKLIQLMRKRGEAISKGNIQDTIRSNIKINEYIKSEKGKREMNTIKSAFVTFQTEEGHDEAQNYIKNPKQY